MIKTHKLLHSGYKYLPIGYNTYKCDTIHIQAYAQSNKN